MAQRPTISGAEIGDALAAFMRREKAWVQARRDALASEGRCVECTDHNPRPRSRTCPACLRGRAQERTAKEQARKAAGLCVKLTCPEPSWRPGARHCEAHRIQANAAVVKARAAARTKNEKE